MRIRVPSGLRERVMQKNPSLCPANIASWCASLLMKLKYTKTLPNAACIKYSSICNIAGFSFTLWTKIRQQD